MAEELQAGEDPADIAPPARRPGPFVRWTCRIGVALAVGAPLLALAMALATGADWLHYSISLGTLFYLPWVAIAGAALALVALVALLFRRRWRRIWLPLAAIVFAAIFVLLVLYNFGKAATVPPIHDVTTDLSNPPAFVALELREDNRAIVPSGGDPRLEPLDNAMRWRIYHAEAYPDIRTLAVPTSVPDTIAAAERLAGERGWEIADVSPAAGRLEATDTVSIYRFKDDVVLRVAPNPNGPGSLVDMRSVSRVGVSDLGVNAERVRAFLADLAAEAGAG